MRLLFSGFPYVFASAAVLFAGCTTHSKASTPDRSILSPPSDPKIPRPDFNVQTAILTDNPVCVNTVGVTGRNARWSNYGEYVQRMIDTVQAGWNNILDHNNGLPPSGTYVTVTFRLKSDGTVSQVVKVEGNSSDLGQKYCVSAITDRASYGKWTDNMVARLGTQQEITFTFYYR